MYSQEQFNQASLKERYALRQILPLLKSNRNLTYTTYYTPYDGTDEYDCLLQSFNDTTLKHRYIIEAKIRTAHYDTLQLEVKKYKALQTKVLDPHNTTLVYAVFTPQGTYVYNLTKIFLEQQHISYVRCNKTSVTGSKEKVSKGSYYLTTDKAKYINYTYSETAYESDLTTQQEVVEDTKKVKRRACLYEYLTAINKQ